MKKDYSYFARICFALIIICFCYFESNAQIITNSTQISELLSDNTRLFNEFTNQAAIDQSYHAGLISKGEAMQASMLNENRKLENIYGKVVDQDGNPIAGVDVTGSIAQRQGWYAADKWDKYKTETDTNGLFQFTGLTGADWAVNVEKNGYEMDYRVGWSGPRGGPRGSLTTLNNRAVLTMWKLKESEPEIHIEIGDGVACNGATTRFDLLSGKKSPDGDLIVKLTRNPIDIDRRRPFNWSITIAIQDGGFREITNIYPYEAPLEGYQSEVTYNFQTNAPNWTFHITPALYFKSNGGQIYGRMTLNIMANFQPPPTYFGAEVYANPAGSRNLQFDYKKQIR